jgi:hypothetical protein
MKYAPAYDDWDDLYMLLRDIFLALSIAWFLYAAHRIANGLMLTGRVESLSAFGDAYTPEEREALIHSVKQTSLKY